MPQENSNDEVVNSLNRIARILAGLLLKDIEEDDQIRKIARLKMCGLSNAEIAQMLGTTVNTIKSQNHRLRKTGGNRRKRPKPAVRGR